MNPVTPVPCDLTMLSISSGTASSFSASERSEDLGGTILGHWRSCQRGAQITTTNLGFSLPIDDTNAEAMTKMCGQCLQSKLVINFAPHPWPFPHEFALYTKTCRDGDARAVQHLAAATCIACRMKRYEMRLFTRDYLFYTHFFGKMKTVVGCLMCEKENDNNGDRVEGGDSFMFEFDHGRRHMSDFVKTFNVSAYAAHGGIEACIDEVVRVYTNPGGGTLCAYHHRVVTAHDREEGRLEVAPETEQVHEHKKRVKFITKKLLSGVGLHDENPTCALCARVITPETASAFDCDHLDRAKKCDSLGAVVDACCVSETALELGATRTARVLFNTWPEIKNLRLLCASCHRIETRKQYDQDKAQWMKIIEDFDGGNKYVLTEERHNMNTTIAIMLDRLKDFVAEFATACGNCPHATSSDAFRQFIVSFLQKDVKIFYNDRWKVFASHKCLATGCEIDLLLEDRWKPQWGGERFQMNLCGQHHFIEQNNQLNDDPDVRCMTCGAETTHHWYGQDWVTRVDLQCNVCYRKEHTAKKHALGLACVLCEAVETPCWYGSLDDPVCRKCYDLQLTEKRNNNPIVYCEMCQTDATRVGSWHALDEGGYLCHDCYGVRRTMTLNADPDVFCSECEMVHILSSWRQTPDGRWWCNECYHFRYRDTPVLNMAGEVEMCRHGFPGCKGALTRNANRGRMACLPCNNILKFNAIEEAEHPRCLFCGRNGPELSTKAWCGAEGHRICGSCRKRYTSAAYPRDSPEEAELIARLARERCHLF